MYGLLGLDNFGHLVMMQLFENLQNLYNDTITFIVVKIKV